MVVSQVQDVTEFDPGSSILITFQIITRHHALCHAGGVWVLNWAV